jgi:hypothetical protein
MPPRLSVAVPCCPSGKTQSRTCRGNGGSGVPGGCRIDMDGTRDSLMLSALSAEAWRACAMASGTVAEPSARARTCFSIPF